jgi:hypothetical protein
MSQHFYVTLNGLPLSFNLQFPFHSSAGGSDYFVLHGKVALENGAGTHAEVAVHLSQVVKAVIGVDGERALAAAINSIRKTVDTKDIEFLKSNKKQPVHLSSRMWSIVQEKFTFHTANDEQIAEFLKQKAHWTQRVTGQGTSLNDEVEAIYLGTTVEKMKEIARKLTVSGEVRVEGDKLLPGNLNAAAIEAKTAQSLRELEAKHEFERTVAHH